MARLPESPDSAVRIPAGSPVVARMPKPFHIGDTQPAEGGGENQGPRTMAPEMALEDTPALSGGPSEDGRMAMVKRLNSRGGLNPSALARVLTQHVYPETQGVSVETYSHCRRGLRFLVEDAQLMGELAGEKRSTQDFIREALDFMAANPPPPDKLKDRHAALTRDRKKAMGAGETVTQGLSVLQAKKLGLITRRTNLSDKAVLEACAMLYLDAYLKAAEEE